MQRKPNRAVLSALVLSFSMSTGCLVVDPDRDPCWDGSCEPVVDWGLGNMGFYWAFELFDGTITDSCVQAEVSNVDIRVYNTWGDLEFAALLRPCSDLGAILTRFETDDYTLELTARCPSGVITHQAVYEVSVFAGENEYGDLILDYIGPCL